MGTADTLKKLGSWFLPLLGLAFLVFCGAIYWNEYRRDSVLSSRGIETTANLDSTYTEYKRRGVTEKYSLTYKFSVNNRTYTGQSDLQTLPATGDVRVLYDPRNPETNQLKGALGFYDDMSTLLAAAVIGVVLGVIQLVVNWIRR